MKRPSPYSCLNSLPPLIKAISYFDTVRVWLPHHLNKEQKASLKKLCGSLNYHGRKGREFDICRFKLNGRMHRYAVAVLLNQPSSEAIAFLAELFPRDIPPIINSVHIALDFLTCTTLDAERIQTLINRSLYRGYLNRKEPPKSVKGTWYSHPRGAPSVLTSYSDRPCRHTGSPCCHVEIRLHRVKRVRDIGIDSLDDLLAFDHLAYWSKHLDLRRIEVEKLGKRLKGRHFNAKPKLYQVGSRLRNADAWHANHVLRLIAYRHGLFLSEAPLMVLQHGLRAKFECDLKGVLTKIDNSVFLHGLQVWE